MGLLAFFLPAPDPVKRVKENKDSRVPAFGFLLRMDTLRA
jgi:hypothetical protein